MYYNQGCQNQGQSQSQNSFLPLLLMMTLMNGEGTDDSLLFLILLMTMM